MLRRVFCATILVSGFNVGALAAGSPEYLLRLETRGFSTFACNGFESETLVFRDGLVTDTVRRDTGVLNLARYQSSTAALARLGEALSQNRVGVEHGGCAVDFFEPNASYGFTLTWFGKGDRSNTFTATAPAGSPCPESTDAIFRALADFLSDASGDPHGAHEELQGEATPPCDDVAP